VQIQASLTPERRFENEAERLRLKQQLLKLEGGSTVSSTSGNSSRANTSSRASSATAHTAGNSASLFHGSETSTVTTTAAQPSMVSLSSSPAAVTAEPGVQAPTRKGPVPPKIPELVSGHYLLDFGCVIKGVNKSRKVKLTNMSTQYVSHLLRFSCSQRRWQAALVLRVGSWCCSCCDEGFWLSRTCNALMHGSVLFTHISTIVTIE
jgi:hypothetical protein